MPHRLTRCLQALAPVHTLAVEPPFRRTGCVEAQCAPGTTGTCSGSAFQTFSSSGTECVAVIISLDTSYDVAFISYTLNNPSSPMETMVFKSLSYYQAAKAGTTPTIDDVWSQFPSYGPGFPQGNTIQSCESALMSACHDCPLLRFLLLLTPQASPCSGDI